MPPLIATLLFALGILGLFWLDRDRESRVSRALWLPVIWLAIGSSRTIAEWLGAGPRMDSPDVFLEGNPIDAVLYAGLEILALLVLGARRERTKAFLRANFPLLLFFLYCGVSVLWSDFPFVAFKRWTKATGNLLMVLVVLTEPDPLAAVKRLLARCGFVLIPLSVLFIKYYPELGRGFDTWTGAAQNIGIATSKNALGWICLVFGLGALWRFLGNFHNGDRSIGSRWAHGSILAMTAWLLWMADSATSLGCFLIGGAMLLLTKWRGSSLRPVTVHILVAGIVGLMVFSLLISPELGLAQAVGRDATLTNRTVIWEDVLSIRINPWFGAGFESFWLGQRIELIWEKWKGLNQAHNGYLEFYLTGGWVGAGVLGFTILWGYFNVIRRLHDRSWAGLLLAFFMATVIQNFTEATFKVMHPVWIAFLLAVMVVPAAQSESRVIAPSRTPRRNTMGAGGSGITPGVARRYAGRLESAVRGPK